MNSTYGTYIQKAYIEELKRAGKRKKARCFFEYQADTEYDEKNSFGFYAKSWEVSKSTAHSWIKEFNQKITLFFDNWHFKNARQYNYAKNQAERLPNGYKTNLTPESTIITGFAGINETEAEHLQNKDINTTTTTQSQNQPDIQDVEYYRLQSELRLCNGKYVGKNEDIYEAYLSIKDLIDIKVLLNAYKKYVNKGLENKTVGFKKFIKGAYYLPYLPTTLRVHSENNNFEGVYSLKDEILILNDGRRLSFTHSKYIEKLQNREITFL